MYFFFVCRYIHTQKHSDLGHSGTETVAAGPVTSRVTSSTADLPQDHQSRPSLDKDTNNNSGSGSGHLAVNQKVMAEVKGSRQVTGEQYRSKPSCWDDLLRMLRRLLDYTLCCITCGCLRVPEGNLIAILKLSYHKKPKF